VTTIELRVNGRAVSESVEPRTHLADFLRDRMHLTGTHLRCEHGVCGACTLLIDGQPARGCITYAVLCHGAEITTIEGLEHDPVVAALRRAFTAEHGLQCGFCTPAMLMTARDIILRLPDADEARVRIELSGNLCRCTGYVGIVRAVLRALQEFRRGEIAIPGVQRRPLGPVGARPAQMAAGYSGRDQVRSGSFAEIDASAENAVPGPEVHLRDTALRDHQDPGAQVTVRAGANVQWGFMARVNALLARVFGTSHP
jgi:carbon-monoxide dehydrogenase small subunit